MTRLTLLAVPLLLCLACSREQPAPAPAAPEMPVATAPADAPMPAAAPAVATAPQDPATRFDAGAFSGTFAADGTRLELHADGSYGMEGPEGITQGSWTHEAASGSIRLDPGSKTAQDRVYRISDQDTLAADGASLRRQATP